MNIIFLQVLFRYALAILKSVEEKLLRQNDYMSLFSTFKTEVESLGDMKELTQVGYKIITTLFFFVFY